VRGGGTDPQGIVRSAADLKRPIGSDSRCLAASLVATIAAGPGEPAVRTEGVFTVKTLKLWVGPAVLVALWIIAAAFTLSQLATVAPSLLSTGIQPPRMEEQREPAA